MIKIELLTKCEEIRQCIRDNKFKKAEQELKELILNIEKYKRGGEKNE